MDRNTVLKDLVARTHLPVAPARMLIVVGDAASTAQAAAAIAKDLKRDLVHVSQVEKHLDRILVAARAGHVVLFFDEADALFGKRSDVKDSHDRYANMEVGALLQRIETQPGVVIVGTRRPHDLDPAFVRRFATVTTVVPKS